MTLADRIDAALAGIDVDKPESDIFGWVMELPVAVSA